MILNKENWNLLDYEHFLNYLYTLKDQKYKEFHQRIILSDNLIGIRTPILKKIAKEISKGNYQEFIKYNKHNLYEEKIIHGFIIGYIKENPLLYLDNFIQYIDNWAICDMTIANIKWFKINNKLEYIDKYIHSNNLWSKRVGIVLLLDYYITDDYIDNIYTYCNNINSNEYYVQMACAWLLSMCYIKYKSKTLTYLSNCNLDNFTYNKTIQKITESLKIPNNEKNELRKLKR